MPASVRPRLIGIDGRSGAGKTQLAESVRRELLKRGHRVVVFSLDEIYPGWDGLRSGVEYYAQTLLPQLAAGKPAEYRRWDWYARGPEAGVDGAPGATVTLTPGDIVLCEGVGATAGDARGWLDLAVWLEAPEHLRQRRALERDGDTYRGHWRQWADQEADLFRDDTARLFQDDAAPHSQAPEHDVDVVVDSSTPNDAAAALVIGRIEELLVG